MSVFSSSVVLVILTLIWTSKAADQEVSCRFSQTCTLPCSFPAGDEVVIHWILWRPDKVQVHSYYNNKDQLDLQNTQFTGRTSLFNELISKGNASLQLIGVKVQDEGRYQCYSSTISGNKEAFIQLKVYAPIQEVKLLLKDRNLTCSADGIYPKPELTWEPGPNPPPESTRTRSDQGLFSISSSVTPSAVNQSCSISSGRSRKSATLFQQVSLNGSDSETTLPCQTSDSSFTDVTWRFNHSQIILQRRGAKGLLITSEWLKYVKDVSETGSLTLKGLTSGQDGIYTCELSNTEDTHIKNTLLHVTAGEQTKTVAIAVGVTAGILVILAAGLIGYCKFQKDPDNKDSNSKGEGHEADKLNKGKPDSAGNGENETSPKG